MEDGNVSENITLNKSKTFAVRVVRLYQFLTETKREYVLSKQLLRSGTSIGANVREAHNSQSKKEFIAKMNIALKEAAESEYWLELLHETDYLSDTEFSSIMRDCGEMNRLLISIIKTSNKQ
jgi:four helix bundle protein